MVTFSIAILAMCVIRLLRETGASRFLQGQARSWQPFCRPCDIHFTPRRVKYGQVAEGARFSRKETQNQGA